MAAEKNVLGFVDTSRKIRRPPLVGMEFLHQRAVSAGDDVLARPGLQAKDLVSLLLGHFSTGRGSTAPKVRIRMRVLTPAGIPAVKIRHQ